MRASLTIPSLTVLCLFLLLSAAGPAAAKTADGLPPSVEVTCAKEAACAFGQCNSYCEAKDCHCYYDLSCTPRASQNSCDNQEAHYIAMTGHEPPCNLAAKCPCLDDDNWSSQEDTWFEFISGGILPTGCSDVAGELAVTVVLSDGFWAASADTVGLQCRILQPNLGTNGDALIGLSVEQAEACRQLLLVAAGSVCPP